MSAVIDLKNCTIRFVDGATGTGKPNKLVIEIKDGDLSYTEKKTREYIKSRGVLNTVVNGDEEPVDVSFSFIWKSIKGNTSTTVTPEDALKKINGASAWVSSDADLCNPYALDITIDHDPNCAEKLETITLSDFRYEQLDHDFNGRMIKCTGRCNITQATATRSVQT